MIIGLKNINCDIYHYRYNDIMLIKIQDYWGFFHAGRMRR